MVQINTSNLKNFVDKAKSNKSGSGKVIIDNQELIAAALDLANVLLYVRDLESEVLKLKKELAESNVIQIEMTGEKF
jgi:hypothetical protein